MKIISVVGARPNFMKIAPIIEAINIHNKQLKRFEKNKHIEHLLVHTGQHYDENMSKLFFEDLEIPRPDIDLNVGSASHAFQTAEIMKRFEPILLRHKPDYIIVVGAVNSTIACSLTASKLGTKIVHVEAGLRSFDRTMPEEINRVLTDSLSDILFTTEKSAHRNLLREGIKEEKIFFVGNVMIDTLIKHKEKASRSNILTKMGIRERSYSLVTLHRPSNVDVRDTLEGLLCAFKDMSQNHPVIFPCHPRTRERIKAFKLMDYINRKDNGKVSEGINLCDPLGYLDFVNLMANARLVLTDSGGIQEETTILGIPCITLRENTERPVTVTEGTNTIVGTDKEKIVEKSYQILNGHNIKGRIPEFWDGKASERIVKVLMNAVYE